MMIIDMHCDTISKLVNDQSGAKLRRNCLNVDLEKLRQGGSLAQFFALFIDLEQVDNPLEYVLLMLDRFYQELAANQETIALARNHQDLLTNEVAGKISAFLTIEEGATLRGEIANLRNFYRLGVRLVTLTWNYPNELGFPSKEEKYMNSGLTEFGREVVTEMNRLGMLIDVSHLSDGGFHDVARLSTQPFVASHSNSRVLNSHRRNLTDEMIRILADKGGVTGLNFSHNFLGSSPISLIEDMVRHIRHIVNVGGIDVMALGTDFDGIDPLIEISDFSEMPKLTAALSTAGFSDDDIEKIYRRNAERVISEVLR